jgi:hypothetical protein
MFRKQMQVYKLLLRIQKEKKSFVLKVLHITFQNNWNLLAMDISSKHKLKSDINQDTAAMPVDLSKLGRFSYDVANFLIPPTNHRERSTILHLGTVSCSQF